MDCYFAAIEELCNPKLVGLPVAVGCILSRGVISSANYIARSYKVKSGMATSKALSLCPNLIILPVRMPLYRDFSRKIKLILLRYSSLVEMNSLDEAYIDVTDSSHFMGSATMIANAMRSDLLAELGLRSSAGVSNLKFLAKIASDFNKPNGLCVVLPENNIVFLDKLPLEKIPGVGKSTLAKLHLLGLFFAGQLRQHSCCELVRVLGKLGSVLWFRCSGIDNTLVTASRIRKSFSVQHTLSEDIASYDLSCQILTDFLFPKLKLALENYSSNLSISKQGVKIKFNDLSVVTICRKHAMLDIAYFKLQLQIILQKNSCKLIRLIGVFVYLPDCSSLKQLSFDF